MTRTDIHRPMRRAHRAMRPTNTIKLGQLDPKHFRRFLEAVEKRFGRAASFLQDGEGIVWVVGGKQDFKAGMDTFFEGFAALANQYAKGNT